MFMLACNAIATGHILIVMAATVQVGRKTGAGAGTFTDITSINTRMNAADAHTTADTASPVSVPEAGSGGTNRSYWATTRLKVTAGSYTTIDNLRVYSDGSNNLGTGLTCKVAKASTGANAGYRQATGSTGNGTTLNTTNHTGLDATPADFFSYNSGSPLALSGSSTASATGEFGDHVVFQIEVTESAGSGASAAETAYYKYDEI